MIISHSGTPQLFLKTRACVIFCTESIDTVLHVNPGYEPRFRTTLRGYYAIQPNPWLEWGTLSSLLIAKIYIVKNTHKHTEDFFPRKHFDKTNL